MKKIIILLLVLGLLLPVAVNGSSTGESLADQMSGAWYLNEHIQDGKKSDRSGIGEQMTFVFNADGTGTIQDSLFTEEGRITAWEEKDGGIDLTLESGTAQYHFRLVPWEDKLLFYRGASVDVMGRTRGEKSTIQVGIRAEYTCRMPEDSEKTQEELMNETVSILQQRLARMGYEDAVTVRVGTDRIRVEAAGAQDGNVFDRVASKGLLEFVNADGKTFMTGDLLASAEYSWNMGSHGIAFTLNEEGTRRFAEETAASIGRNIRIYLDGRLLVDATIREAITGGKGTISGPYSSEEAAGIAAVMGTPVLPGELTQLSIEKYSDIPLPAEEEEAEIQQNSGAETNQTLPLLDLLDLMTGGSD